MATKGGRQQGLPIGPPRKYAKDRQRLHVSGPLKMWSEIVKKGQEDFLSTDQDPMHILERSELHSDCALGTFWISPDSQASRPSASMSHSQLA